MNALSHANWGRSAIAAGTPDYVENDDQTNLADTLANLMHEAERSDLDFEQALTTARGHFATETEALPA